MTNMSFTIAQNVFQIFSGWTFLRCLALAMKLLDCTYYVTILYGRVWNFIIVVIYTVNETVSFYILSSKADSLREKASVGALLVMCGLCLYIMHECLRIYVYRER